MENVSESCILTSIPFHRQHVEMFTNAYFYFLNDTSNAIKKKPSIVKETKFKCLNLFLLDK